MNEEEKESEQTGAEQGGHPGGTPGSGAEDVPQSEEEVRARIEEQIRNLGVEDLMVESVVSVLNLTARRIAKEDERDLDQARVGIDAVRAWVDLLPDDAATQIRNALSELQMLYAAAVEEGDGGKGGAEGEQTGAEQTEADRGTPASEQSSDYRSSQSDSLAEDVPRTGSEPPPRIWTPPGSK
jgi:hypothetical protein